MIPLSWPNLWRIKNCAFPPPHRDISRRRVRQVGICYLHPLMRYIHPLGFTGDPLSEEHLTTTTENNRLAPCCEIAHYIRCSIIMLIYHSSWFTTLYAAILIFILIITRTSSTKGFETYHLSAWVTRILVKFMSCVGKTIQNGLVLYQIPRHTTTCAFKMRLHYRPQQHQQRRVRTRLENECDNIYVMAPEA